MAEDLVLCDVAERVAVVTLNRPNALNALSDAVLAALAGTLDRIAADPEVRVVVIRGAGKAKVSSNHSLRQGNSGGSQVSYDEESSYKTYQTRIGSSANKVNLAFEEALPELKKGLITSIAGLF